MPEWKYVTYEPLNDGKVARIMLNRPETRNAQSRGLLVDLNEAFLHAEADDDVPIGRFRPVGPDALVVEYEADPPATQPFYRAARRAKLAPRRA